MPSLRIIVVCALGCSPATPSPELGKPPEPLGGEAGVAKGPGFATPSKWALTFSPRWRGAASIDLDGGSKLRAGEGGERWIENAAGEHEGASALAPEALVGIQRSEGVYRFVGASGTVYVAHQPLGALLRTGNPVAGTRQVAVGKSAILVVDGKGELERSTDGGRTWSKIDLPQKDLVVVDVAMLGDGGILVAAPQRFFGTKDDGITWTPVKSPGIGVQTVVARDGALWVDGVDDSLRFDPAWATFQPGQAPRPRTAAWRARRTQAPVSIVRIDGRRAVKVEGAGLDRTWSVEVDDMAGPGRPRKVDELDGCDFVDAAVRGDEIVLACDARGSVAGGIDRDASGSVQRYGYNTHSTGAPDGGSLGWITRIVRSTDGGRSFREETTVEGGIPQHNDVTVAIGPEGFVYLGRRCGPGYYAPCLPPRVRASRSAGFSELPDDDSNVGHVRFATTGAQSSFYSLAIRDGEAFLERWKLGSAAPEAIGRVAATLDLATASLGLDDDGTVRGFGRSGTSSFVFTYKEGGTIATSDLGVPLVRASFAGVHGFGYVASMPTETKAYETFDGGKTWGVVGAPAYIGSVDACSAYGCVTDRGVRWGWDAPPGTPDGAVAQSITKADYGRPLRCNAKDRWIELGGGNLPSVGYVDHGSVRWLLPTRDKDGKIALLLSKRGEATTKTTSVALLGPPAGPPKFGAGTTVHVQPDGVVALRYTYPRERKGFGRYNPVDADVAWYRDATGKVSRGGVPKNPPFRVNKDPQGAYDRDAQPAYSELPEILALGSKGVYFHAASYPGEDETTGNPKRQAVALLRDDGKVERTTMPEALDSVSGTGLVALLDGAPSLLARSPENIAAYALSDGHKNVYSVLGGLGDDDGTVDLLSVGGKPFLGVTLRDPAHAWLVQLKADSDLGTVTPLPTQKSLGDVPKPCDGAPPADPSAYRIDEPYVLGSRRPVVIDSDGIAIVMATDRAEVRGTFGQADACVAAFDAMLPAAQDEHDYSALVFTDDLGHSLLFKADTASWPATISVRPMECQYQAGPIPDDLQTVEGFTPDTRHSAVPRKRF